MVTINLYSIHGDEQVWEQPPEFKPERFLETGRVWKNAEKIMLFGYGKRTCPGESTARLTIFIFLASLLQKFTFSVTEGHETPSLSNLRGVSGTPVKLWASVGFRK